MSYMNKRNSVMHLGDIKQFHENEKIALQHQQGLDEEEWIDQLRPHTKMRHSS